MRKIKALLAAAFVAFVPAQVVAADFLTEKYIAVAFTVDPKESRYGWSETYEQAADMAMFNCSQAYEGCIPGPAVEMGALFVWFDCPSYGPTIIARNEEGMITVDTAVLEVVSPREFHTECEVQADNFNGSLDQWMQVADPFYFD